MDNFSKASKMVLEVMERIADQLISFYEVDVRSKEDLKRFFEFEKPKGLIHFAALKAVGELSKISLIYYDK